MSAFVSLPAALAETRTVAGHGGRAIRLYRWRRGNAGGPALLWGHANGFAAGSYATLFAALAAELDVYAFDAAGQGGSAQPEAGADLDAFCAPDALADDAFAVASAAREWAGRPLVYGAHSLCGAAMLRLAVTDAARFSSLALRGLVLFEPPAFPPEGHRLHAAASANSQKRIARTSVRRAEFPGGPAELAAYLTGREIFKGFRPDQIDAHAGATLRPDGATWRLACTPETETAVFRAFRGPVLFPLLDRIPADLPVRLVSGDLAMAEAEGASVTAMMPDVARKIGHARLTELAGATHMMVFEREAECARLLKAFAADPRIALDRTP
jgi:pimeloyl-ACP methyl ester carboxylesterase